MLRERCCPHPPVKEQTRIPRGRCQARAPLPLRRGKPGQRPPPSRYAPPTALPRPPPDARSCRRASPAGSRAAASPLLRRSGHRPPAAGGAGACRVEGPTAPHTPAAAPAAAPSEPTAPEEGGPEGGPAASPPRARGAERALRVARASGRTRPLPDGRPAPAAASPLLFLRRQDGGAVRGRPSPTQARPTLPPASLLARPSLPRADWTTASAAVARGAGRAAGAGQGRPGGARAPLGPSGPPRPRSASRPGSVSLPRRWGAPAWEAGPQEEAAPLWLPASARDLPQPCEAKTGPGLHLCQASASA